MNDSHIGQLMTGFLELRKQVFRQQKEGNSLLA